MAENNRDFFNQLLERAVENVCLWEHWESDKRRIYEVTGRFGWFGERFKFQVYYPTENTTTYKTMEEMAQDYIATPADLIGLGKSIGTKK